MAQSIILYTFIIYIYLHLLNYCILKEYLKFEIMIVIAYWSRKILLNMATCQAFVLLKYRWKYISIDRIIF